MSSPELPLPAVDPQRQQELRHIQDALRGLKFGTVNIVVQDGVIVQLDRTEKRRLSRSNSESSPRT